MTPEQAVILFFVGAIASAINSVAGGGSLISFPYLVFGIGLPSNVANSTNSVSLWPGSLGSALGFSNLYEATKGYMKSLLVPTVVGSAVGAQLLVVGGQRTFDIVVPFLILIAATLLWVQPTIKKLISSKHPELPIAYGIAAQFIVAVYGGYFGAGMGIMMLASFALYMAGTIHELNAIKAWLGTAINLVASLVLGVQGLVDWRIALWLTLGSIVGGFLAAKYSQKLDPNKLRIAIAVYGVLMAGYYAYSVWF